jgi:glycosyltransferase involved in cell wall biosynthesis
MVIAVNTRFLLNGKLEGVGYFEKEVFTRIAQDHPEHSFYFLFDRKTEITGWPSNVKTIETGPPARHPLLWKIWFDLKIPRILNKIKADVFVSPDGFLSLRTKIPQCLVVHDLGFLHQPEAYKGSHLWYLNNQLPKFLKKAKRIATVSGFTRKDIVKQYRIDESKIDIVFSAAKEIFHPLSREEKTAVKENFTGGKEYFIYAGAIQPRKNLVNLLKAFSVFKKWQQSDWKLVLTGRVAWKNEAFIKLLKTFKYREDVILTGYVPETDLVNLLGSAYALVYPSYFEGFGVPVLEAIRAGIPPLTSAGSSMEEIAGEAALYFDPSDHKDIAEKMMRIYKDEPLRNQLIENGKKIVNDYSWDRTAELLWHSIERTTDLRSLC